MDNPQMPRSTSTYDQRQQKCPGPGCSFVGRFVGLLILTGNPNPVFIRCRVTGRQIENGVDVTAHLCLRGSPVDAPPRAPKTDLIGGLQAPDGAARIDLCGESCILPG